MPPFKRFGTCCLAYWTKVESPINQNGEASPSPLIVKYTQIRLLSGGPDF